MIRCRVASFIYLKCVCYTCGFGNIIHSMKVEGNVIHSDAGGHQQHAFCFLGSALGSCDLAMVSAEIQSVNRIQTVLKFDWFILLVLL